MEAKEKKDKTVVRSWRNITQIAGRKAVTKIARNRKIVSYCKNSAIGLSAIAIAAGLFFGVQFAVARYGSIKLAGPSENVRRILFRSDGVLSHDWVQKVVRIPAATEMMDVDIFAIKELLESHGQVREAEVWRRFPDQLEIALKEREPLLRARVPARREGFDELLVAADGTIYTGFDYSEEGLREIPYLGGLTFRREADGFQPVPGMETLKELLILARERYPEIYRTWRVVSCEDFSGARDRLGEVIKIGGTDIREVVFFPDGFEGQLDRLAHVVEYSQQRRVSVLKRVDLSLGEQVSVHYYAKLNPGAILRSTFSR